MSFKLKRVGNCDILLGMNFKLSRNCIYTLLKYPLAEYKILPLFTIYTDFN